MTEAARPTPADPLPGTPVDPTVPSARRERTPPELGIDAIAVLEGRAFMYSDSLGDVPRGSIGGLVYADTRFLDRWELTIGGKRPKLLRSHTVDYYSAAFFLTNPTLDDVRENTLSIRRRRFVGDGMREEISVHSYADHPVKAQLRLAVGTDFADLFEIKADVRDRSAQITAGGSGSEVTFAYENEGFNARTLVETETAPSQIDGTTLVWDLELLPRGKWKTTLTAHVHVSGLLLKPSHEDFGDKPKKGDDPLSRWLDELPRFRMHSELFGNVLQKSIDDLTALRITADVGGMEFTLPAAGLPWFMTLFGRDTLFTSFMTIGVGPQLARGALFTLALGQGKKVDDFHDEEPGKILHEFRAGELTQLGLKPHNPYYGAVDSTPLFLIVLSAYWHWTQDGDFVTQHWPNVLAALEWIDRYGDLDGDGFIDYQTRSTQGLGNQCWRDSWDGVQFADGHIPYLPIAIAEAQGYVYDAKLRIAQIAEDLMDDADLAARLRKEAVELRDRFNDQFWIEARGGYYAIGLDGDKAPIDSMTSNQGHLLWSGIVPDDRAARVAANLMGDAMFSGWGVRTLSEDDEGFNPVGYHTGTIWPHDNAIIAAGLSRYGFRDEANRIALAMLEAASFSEFRLPEAFAGFDKSAGSFPVPYPTACSPQAWATAAPFVLLATMLGVRVEGGKLVLHPHVPKELGRIFVHGLHAFGTHFDIEAEGDTGEIRPTK
ncbi:MAG: glycogen debranching N-terminal domain-containing protein [Actinomycetota bacterium]